MVPGLTASSRLRTGIAVVNVLSLNPGSNEVIVRSKQSVIEELNKTKSPTIRRHCQKAMDCTLSDKTCNCRFAILLKLVV